MRFITLTSTEQKQLERLLRTSPNEVVRRRSHCLLLSAKGLPTTQLAQVFEVCQPTLYNWFNAWEQHKLNSLAYRPGQGRKPKLKEVPPEVLTELVRTYPRSLDTVVRQLAKHHGVECHRDTLKRQLRRHAITVSQNQSL